jgi:RNA polymerase-binding protein DksA
MARSTRKSIAGQAASAARKLTGRRSAVSAEQAPSSTTRTAAKKAPTAKAAPAKKAAPATKAAPAKTAAPAKKAAPAAKKAAPTKAAAAKKAAPATKAAATKKAAPAARKAAPVKKTAPAARKTAAKKASPAKKAPMSALVVKEGEQAWTKAELAEVLAELHEQREHSTQIITQQESELSGLMRDAGDGAGHDQADLGATSFERDHELTVLNNERDKLAQIERALGRIDDGTYGVCESCGNPIGKMRLMAFPRATLCMTCKQREERR